MAAGVRRAASAQRVLWAAPGTLTVLLLDAASATLQRIDGRNLVTTNTVDALNRIVGQLYLDGTRATNTFDAAGQQLTMQDVTGVTQYGWDLASRLTSVQNGLGVPLSYTLDAVGNRLKMQDPHGSTLYSWDVQNRLVQIQNPQCQLTSISWDALDRESSRIPGNGMQVLHSFDASGRETLLQNLSAAGAALAMFTSLHDAASNRTQLQELDGSVVNYGYDPIYQLQNEMRTGTNSYNTTYLNDPAGNRLQKIDIGQVTTGLFNSANELVLLTPPTGPPTTIPGVRPPAPDRACTLPNRSAAWSEHSPGDANGNLSVEQTGAALTSYTWDGENRLLFVDSSAGRSSYLYSADGLRQSAIEPPNTPNSGKSHFVWDAQNLLLRYDGSLALQDRYTDYPGYWGGLASQWRSGGNSSFYGFDPQGSTRILVSIAGVITDSYSYKAFGEKLSESGATVNPLRYEGQYSYYRDLDTRLYVRAREYEPEVGRWVSKGLPAVKRGGYRYRGNSPTGLGLGGIDLPICVIPCAPCLACAIDLGIVCSDCGTDWRCWADCVINTWKNLPGWTKWLCGLACAACLACLANPCDFSASRLVSRMVRTGASGAGLLGADECLAKLGDCQKRCSEWSTVCGIDFWLCCSEEFNSYCWKMYRWCEGRQGCEKPRGCSCECYGCDVLTEPACRNVEHAWD